MTKQTPLPGMPESTTWYLSSLATPRPDILARDASLSPEPFLESDTFKTAVAAYDASEKTFHDQIGAASDIATIVRKSLRYKTARDSKELLRPDAVARTAETNCYGYTLVMSEALEVADIPHYIGFTNNHTFIMLADTETGHVFMLDSVTRKFDGDITEALQGESPLRQLEERSGGEVEDKKRYATNRFDTKTLLQLRNLSKKTDELMRKSPWLSFHNPDASHFEFDAAAYDHSFILQLRTYTSEVGRKVLQNYSDAAIRLNRGELDEALAALRGLDGLYPDMDSRNSLEVATQAHKAFMRAKKMGLFGCINRCDYSQPGR